MASDAPSSFALFPAAGRVDRRLAGVRALRKENQPYNQTGDGARRTRVVGGLITYCISERSTATSPEMIAMHGKIRLTNCPQHADTATQQDWRTARD